MEDLIKKLKMLQFSDKQEIMDILKGFTIKKLHDVCKRWFNSDKSYLSGNKELMVLALTNMIKSSAQHCIIRFHGVSEWDALTNDTKCFMVSSFKYDTERKLKYIDENIVGDQVSKAKEFVLRCQ